MSLVICTEGLRLGVTWAVRNGYSFDLRFLNHPRNQIAESPVVPVEQGNDKEACMVKDCLAQNHISLYREDGYADGDL
jgi:hypothetical protein